MNGLHPARTAVLCMDMQSGIVAAYAGDDLVSRAAQVLRRCRSAGMTIIHVRVGFRPGFPEINPRNVLFSAIKSSPRWQQMFDGPASEIHPALAPQQTDIVVTKHRVSAFLGTDLEMILLAQGIETLVLFGIATSGVVLSTLVHASDADYSMVVLRDCCADQDPEVHSCLLNKVFPRRATVIDAEEFLAGLAE